MRNKGFTLLEVLVAATVLVVVMVIVYATYSSVTDSVLTARVSAEEVRLRQFLTRSLNSNLTSAYIPLDPLRADVVFRGEDQRGANGGRDTLEFATTEPLLGAMAMPGMMKVVRYEVLGDEDGGDFGLFEEDAPRFDTPTLYVTETPLMLSGPDYEAELGLGPSMTVTAEDYEDIAESIGFQSPSWSVPVASVDFAYYDGTDWADDWDSTEMGRLPWYVRARISFAKTDEQREFERLAGYNTEEDPDIELVIPVPRGIGIYGDSPMLMEMMDYERLLRDGQ